MTLNIPVYLIQLWAKCMNIDNEQNRDCLEQPRVMLFGTFHFANPGLDKIKNKVTDVMNETSQLYLMKLAERISEFKPTVVLLEYDIKNDLAINDRFTQYLHGNYQLAADEIEQIGFRVAKLSGLTKVDSFDERNTPWKSEKLFEQLRQEPELEKRFNSEVQKMTEEFNKDHSTLSLPEILRKANSPEEDRKNKALYIMTNIVGVDENFAGADASASWWHRNFRMLARIQKFSKPGERLLVIGGQGHTAVLRDLLKLDSSIELEDIYAYL